MLTNSAHARRLAETIRAHNIPDDDCRYINTEAVVDDYADAHGLGAARLEKILALADEADGLNGYEAEAFALLTDSMMDCGRF